MGGSADISHVCCASVGPQGLNVPPGVTKDDWEEINFEFNSSVLVDGFPSLLRHGRAAPAEPRLQGQRGGPHRRHRRDQYNDRLGLARANAVRDFLVKYGAAPGQIRRPPKVKPTRAIRAKRTSTTKDR